MYLNMDLTIVDFFEEIMECHNAAVNALSIRNVDVLPNIRRQLTYHSGILRVIVPAVNHATLQQLLNALLQTFSNLLISVEDSIQMQSGNSNSIERYSCLQQVTPHRGHPRFCISSEQLEYDLLN